MIKGHIRTIYIKDEDLELWNNLDNKSDFISRAMNSKLQVAKATAKSLVVSKPIKKPVPEIDQMFKFWHESVGYAISSRRQANRNACSNLIKRHGVEGVKRLVMGVVQAESDQYAPRISDFTDLQSKLNQLLKWGKSKQIKPMEVI